MKKKAPYNEAPGSASVDVLLEIPAGADTSALRVVDLGGGLVEAQFYAPGESERGWLSAGPCSYSVACALLQLAGIEKSPDPFA